MKFDAWGDPIPLYRGPAKVNLHTPPKGTDWANERRFGGYYPLCPCHMPAEIAETLRREAMEQALAAQREGRPWVAPKPPVAADTTPPPVAAPEAVEPARSDAQDVPAPPPVDDETGLRLMAKRLRLNAWYRKKGIDR